MDLVTSCNGSVAESVMRVIVSGTDCILSASSANGDR